jgi:hypothetical protein
MHTRTGILTVFILYAYSFMYCTRIAVGKKKTWTDSGIYMQYFPNCANFPPLTNFLPVFLFSVNSQTENYNLVLSESLSRRFFFFFAVSRQLGLKV